VSDTKLLDHLRLYLVVGSQSAPGGLLETVEAALLGGVTAVQLREKSGTDLEILRTAERLRELCTDHGAALFLNDRIDLALAAGADGVHLGVDDLPIPAARRIAHSDFWIGFSPDTDTGARSARLEGASYLGVGPVFGTASKSDAGPAIGLGLLKRRLMVADLPVIGIGGIDASNAASVIQAGAAGVAVMSAILQSADPRAAAESIRGAVDAALE
jgi:thiamine-phosphate diphosphorylase